MKEKSWDFGSDDQELLQLGTEISLESYEQLMKHKKKHHHKKHHKKHHHKHDDEDEDEDDENTQSLAVVSRNAITNASSNSTSR